MEVVLACTFRDEGPISIERYPAHLGCHSHNPRNEDETGECSVIAADNAVIPCLHDGSVEATSDRLQRDEPTDVPFTVKVIVREFLGDDYGFMVWPGGLLLATYVMSKKILFRGRNVLEIGAGPCVPGIVAAKIGASQVILSERADSSFLLDNCKWAIAVNQVENACAIGLTWGMFPLLVQELPPQDIILGADVFYSKADFEAVLATVDFFMKKNPLLIFITSYQTRSLMRSLAHLLEQWDMTARRPSPPSTTSTSQFPSPHLPSTTSPSTASHTPTPSLVASPYARDVTGDYASRFQSSQDLSLIIITRRGVDSATCWC